MIDNVNDRIDNVRFCHDDAKKIDMASIANIHSTDTIIKCQMSYFNQIQSTIAYGDQICLELQGRN